MWEGYVLVHGADVDDSAGPLQSAQAANEGLGEEERSLEVDVENLVVVLLGDVPESRALFNAGVVDEDVAGTELLPGLIDEPLGVFQLRDVCFQNDDLASSSFNLFLVSSAPSG